jgi:hypothetical protein
MMAAILEALFGAVAYTPHGYCLLWQPELIAIHSLSDIGIAFAYFSIPLAIATFMRRRPDVRPRWVAGLFIAFILLCGLTHLAGVKAGSTAYRRGGATSYQSAEA